jgi:hypothetical protein
MPAKMPRYAKMPKYAKMGRHVTMRELVTLVIGVGVPGYGGGVAGQRASPYVG